MVFYLVTSIVSHSAMSAQMYVHVALVLEAFVTDTAGKESSFKMFNQMTFHVGCCLKHFLAVVHHTSNMSLHLSSIFI